MARSRARLGINAIGLPRRDEGVYRDRGAAGLGLADDEGESFLGSAGDRRTVQRAKKIRTDRRSR